MDLRTLLFSFKGRISRRPYWLFSVAVILSAIVLFTILDPNTDFGAFVGGLFSLAILWPSLAVQVKRWHDRDKSGWWVLINLVPLVGPLVALVENGFLRGTVGPNRYGPDPLGGAVAAPPDPG